MKTAKIIKIQRDGEFFSVFFDVKNPTDFDLDQLGEDWSFMNEMGNSVDGLNVTLKVGDSITDEVGGQPILGAVRTDAVNKTMSIVKESDYRTAFENKTKI